MEETQLSEKPEAKVDPAPPEGPGGVDAVGTWEGVHTEEPEVPDQPQSAQVVDEDVPDEIQESEDKDEGEGADDDAASDPTREDPA